MCKLFYYCSLPPSLPPSFPPPLPSSFPPSLPPPFLPSSLPPSLPSLPPPLPPSLPPSSLPPSLLPTYLPPYQVIEDALKDYEISPRVKWVVSWPGQTVLCVSQKYWTDFVHVSIKNGPKVCTYIPMHCYHAGPST